MKEKEHSNVYSSSKIGYFLVFLFLLAIGICLTTLSGALKALAIAIGCVLVVFGIVFFIFTLSKKSRGFSFAFRSFFAIICIIGGIIVIISNEAAIDIIIAIASLFLIIDGSFKLNTTAMSKHYRVPLWWIIFILAILIIAGAFCVLKFPIGDNANLTLILGAIFIIDSVVNLLSAFFIRAFENRQLTEAYIEFYRSKDNPPKKLRKIIKKHNLNKQEKLPEAANDKK